MGKLLANIDARLLRMESDEEEKSTAESDSAKKEDGFR